MRIAAWNWAAHETLAPIDAGVQRGAKPVAGTYVPNWPEDTVELTGLTVREAVAKVDELRLAEIAEQIKAGTYFTEEKLNVVVDRMWEAVRKEPPRANSA